MANTFYGLTLERAIEEEERTLSLLEAGRINESAAMDLLDKLTSAYDYFRRPDLAGRVHEKKGDYYNNKPDAWIGDIKKAYMNALLKYTEARAFEACTIVQSKLLK